MKLLAREAEEVDGGGIIEDVEVNSVTRFKSRSKTTQEGRTRCLAGDLARS